MRKFPTTALLLSAAFAWPLAAGASEPVFVRGTIDGAFVRLPDTKPGDVTIEMPDPRRLIITAENADFSSGARWPRAEFIEHVQVFGPELMGGGTSRVMLRVTVSNMTWRLEQERADTLVILEGATPLRQQWIDARAERATERTERRREREEAGAAEDAARQAAADQRRVRRSSPPATTSNADTEALRAELADTQARLRALEAQVSGSAAPPAGSSPVRTRARRGRNETARLRPGQQSMLPPSPPASSITTPAGAGSGTMRIERSVDGMVRIPSGPFTMGTPMGYGFEDEVPAHVADVSAFEIDELEVTVGDFQRSPVPLPRQPDWNWDADQPVVNVTWREAAQYCEWQEKRLPTEAEWEKAARGPESRSYPWGNQWSPTRANSGLDGDGHSKAAAVGSFALGASPYGALDMAGNVWEWTHDWYDDDYYAESPARDPQGPTRGTYRVARGGSFEGQSAMNVRSAIRMPLKASARRENVGFRCSR